MTVTLECTTDKLPGGFEELEADAEADGHGHTTLLGRRVRKEPNYVPRNIRMSLRQQTSRDRGDYRRACADFATNVADAAALRGSQI